jgi:hypothetical protein
MSKYLIIQELINFNALVLPVVRLFIMVRFSFKNEAEENKRLDKIT